MGSPIAAPHLAFSDLPIVHSQGYSDFEALYLVNVGSRWPKACEWLIARWTPNHKIVGSSPAEATWLIKKRPAWAMGDDNGASVHSAVNEYLALDRDGNIVLRLPSAP